MKRERGISMLLIDVIGGAAVAGLLMSFLYLTFVRSDDTGNRTEELTRAVQSTRRTLAQTCARRDQQRALLTQREAQLAQTGCLPDRAPVEEYFQLLSRLAAGNRLRVVRHNPLGSRVYPGLFERRFTYEVAGSMDDLTRFFREIENTEYWADVSYFRIDDGRSAAAPTSRERVAALTISLFAAMPAETETDDG